MLMMVVEKTSISSLESQVNDSSETKAKITKLKTRMTTFEHLMEVHKIDK